MMESAMEAFDKPRRLTVRDLNNRLDNTADSLPWPQPTEQQHIGSTSKVPAHPCAECRQGRDKCTCSPEVSWPAVMVAVYVAAFLAGLIAPHLIARFQ